MSAEPIDHLISPNDSAVAPLLIPSLCDGGTNYDFSAFHDYPQRQGWATREEPLAWLSCSTDELARRAQIWLYFGTLTEFTGEHVSPASFRSPEGHLMTKGLSGLLRKRTRPDRIARPGDNVSILLKEAARSSEMLEQQLIDATGTLALIACSIRVLLQELGAVTYRTWKVHIPRAIQYRMVLAGWCPA